MISIHALLAESDKRQPGYLCLIHSISIHALLAESDLKPPIKTHRQENFYPRSPCGERQLYINRTAETVIFLSTLSLRRATSFNLFWLLCHIISIHALLAESDLNINRPTVTIVQFLSTLSLRRATVNKVPNQGKIDKFLSTLSLRRATISCARSASKLEDFYPRSPCGERRQTAYFFLAGGGISIHALLAESDPRLDAEY